MSKSKSTKHHRRRGATGLPPLLPVLGVGVGVAASYEGARPSLPSSGLMSGQGLTIFADQLSQSYTGYSFVNSQFYAKNLARGWTPLILGMVGHKGANWLGINRILSRHKLGFSL